VFGPELPPKPGEWAKNEAERQAAEVAQKEADTALLRLPKLPAVLEYAQPALWPYKIGSKLLEESEFGQQQLKLAQESMGEAVTVGTKAATYAPPLLKAASATMLERNIDVGAATPAVREAIRKEAEKAQKEFQQKTFAMDRVEQARKEEEARTAPPQTVNVVEARKLAEEIDQQNKADPKGAQRQKPAQMYYDRRVAQLRTLWGVETETDAAKRAHLEELATQKALAELVHLYTVEGYTTFVPEDALYGGQEKTLLNALKPRMRVSKTGKTARAETDPGWALNVALALPDYALTTAAEAFVKDQAPTMDSLINNIEARRDLLTYQIENDEDLQADIMSGDTTRVLRALAKVGPTMGLMLLNPDTISTITTVAKVPGLAARTARILAKSGDVLKAVNAAEGVAKVEAFIKASNAAQDAVLAAEESARAEKAIEKAQRPLRTADKVFVREMSKDSPDLTAALERMDEAGVAEYATLIRDRIAAYLESDSDVAEFLDAVDYRNKPITTSGEGTVRSLEGRQVRAGFIGDVDAVERGRAKFRAAYEDASKRAADDFDTALRNQLVPERKLREVRPLPVIEDQEVQDLFGIPASEFQDVDRAALRKVSEATTARELADAVKALPPAAQARVVERFGLSTYEDLDRVSRIDTAKIAEATKAREDAVDMAQAVVQDKALNVAALKAKPEDAKRNLELRKAVAAAKTQDAAAKKAMDAFEKKALKELTAKGDAVRAAVERQKEPVPAFVPSKELVKLQETQEKLRAKEAALPKGAKKDEAFGRYLNAADAVYQKQDAEKAAWKVAHGKSARTKAVEDAKKALRETRASLEVEHAPLRAQKVATEKALRDANEAFMGAAPAPRSVETLTPDEQTALDFVGVPVYRRGFGDRVPMEWAAGNEAHFLHLALNSDASASGKYLSGAASNAGVQMFAENAQRIPHVGEALPFADAPLPKADYVVQTVSEPGSKKPKKYDPAIRGSGGLPAQRGLPTEVVWTPEGEGLWSRLEQIADKQRDKKLPRARTLEEYLRSLLPWSDPEAKIEDVDLVRVDDYVRVRDENVAKQVGPIKQPGTLEQRAAGERLVERVSDGVMGRVVGFKQTPEGPVIVVQPNAWNGSAFQPVGSPVEVRPDTLLFMERGRDAGVLHTPTRWKQIRATEDTMRAEGAGSVRYPNKASFREFAPPRRPTPKEFNFNPDKLVRYFTPDEVEKIHAEMRAKAGSAAAPGFKPGVGKPEGAAHDLRIKQAEEAAKRAQEALDQKQKELADWKADVQMHADLQTGIPRETPAYRDVAERARIIEAAPPDRAILPKVEGVEGLVREAAQIKKTLRRADQGFVANARLLWTRTMDAMHPASELQFKSLTQPFETMARQFSGRLRRVDEDLARAYQQIDTTVNVIDATKMNPSVRNMLNDFSSPMRLFLLTADDARAQDLIGAIAEAFTRRVDETKKGVLKDALMAWAEDPNQTVEDLRRTLFELSRDSDPRLVQEGDIHLTKAVATAGAWYEAIMDAGEKGLLRSREEAAAANTFAAGITGTSGQGGRAEASLGRAVMADAMVPEDYRPGVGFGAPSYGKYENYARPFVPSVKLRSNAVESISAMLAQHADLLASGVYIPRPVRDVFAREVDAVVRAAAVGGEKYAWQKIYPDYYRQALVAGILSSKPDQVLADFYGNVANMFADYGPVAAAKVFARSFIAQLLGIPGAAPAATVLDAIRKLPQGSSARAFSALLSFTPEIHAIYTRNPNMQMFGRTASDIHDVARAEKLFENMSSGNLEGTVKRMQKHIRTNSSAPFRWLEMNTTALADHANVAATRTRLSVMYGLMEYGFSPEEAARIARDNIVGDFSGELHPFEEAVVNTLLPFLPYRKWNARTQIKRLRAPFWLTRFLKGENYGAQTLTWLNDDSDEFGFHTDAMDDEFDPEEIGKLREEVISAHQEWDPSGSEVETEALRLAKVNGIPKARVRYNTMVERLRQIAKTQGRRAALEAVKTDEDAQALFPYWAMDPVQSLLDNPGSLIPAYHRERYPVWMQEARSQALQSWRRANIGRYAREDDEERYMLFPADPFGPGIAEAALAVNIATVIKRAAETAAAGGDTPPGYVAEPTVDTLTGFLRSPLVQTMLGTLTNVEAPDTTSDMRILNDTVGSMLHAVGIAKLSKETKRGGDPLAATERVGDKYTIPSELVNLLYLSGPTVSASVLGVAELSNLLTQAAGTSRYTGPVDTKTKLGSTAGALLGVKQFKTSPSKQEYYALQDIERRVQGLAEDMQTENAQYTDVPDEVYRRLAISAHRQSKASEAERRAAVLRTLLPGEPEPADGRALSAYLLDSGYPEEQVLAMNPYELREKVKEAATRELAGKPVTR
jgi:plasmid stability protein